jgi:hypothetical protein
LTNRDINGVEVFSASRIRDRRELDARMTAWMQRRQAEPKKNFEIVDVVVTQSSDSEYHCYSATFFYNES